MIYLGNHNNAVRSAVLSALNVVPSAVVYRTDRAAKAGGGSVSLSGEYSGDADSTFDVEVVDDAGSTPRVSAPAFVGVGNGTLSALAVTGLSTQAFAITLEDLGTVTRHAYAPFQGATLRARDPGADGNLITLRIDASALVDTPTDYATQGDIRVGSNEYVGDVWNFGAPNVNVDGTIPATAPRIRFGFDPQVYLQFRRFIDGQYVYGFSPAPVRDVPAGTPVYLVSGARTVRITDGTTTDTLTGIVTVYDCLSKIRSESTLVEVDGVVVNDLLPNGQGRTELSVWTQPYLTSLTREGTAFVQAADIGLLLGDEVPTQKLTIKCRSVRTPGAEIWSVDGELGLTYADAVTGVAYRAGGYQFTIPVQGADPLADRGTIRVEYLRPSGGGELPAFVAEDAVIGAAGRNGSWEYEYRPKPVAECDEVGELEGGPSSGCLGLIPDIGGDNVSTASLLRRRQRVGALVREIVQSNTLRPLDTVEQDISYIQQAGNVLIAGLDALAKAESLTPAARAADTEYAQDAIVSAVVSGVAYRFAANVGGMSGSGTPTWSATLGATVTDGAVTWENIGKTALGIWDDTYTLLEADAEYVKGVVGTDTAWQVSTPYVVDDVVVVGSPTRMRLRCTSSGTSGTVRPEADQRGTTEIGDTITDNTAEWEILALNLGTTAGSIVYYQRYEAAMVEATMAAGLSANFDVASGQGDGCWQDRDVEYVWAYLGSEPYAPIFTGVYYHAALLTDTLAGVVANSTQEFGFGPRFGCPDLIAPGDRIRVTISNAGGVTTYQQGDRIVLQTTRAVPLEFGGGQTGDDTLTFSVIGSGVGRCGDYALNTTALASYSAARPAWTAAAVIASGVERRPTTRNGRRYSYSGGTTGGSEPTWPTTVGATVADGTGTWTCIGGEADLQFTITPGAIPFALGDRWTFAVETARVQWRQDGGSWSAPAEITAAAIALADGLSAVFTGGPAPSWVAGDRWSFAAEAVNGTARIQSPIDGRLAWDDDLVLEITPALGEEAIAGIALCDHAIPSDAVITLEGSDDDFATSPLDIAIPWRRGDIWHAVEAEYAAYRLTITGAGELGYLWMGATPLRLQLRTGATELGRVTKRIRLPGASARPGLSVDVAHEWVAASSVDALVELLEHACTEDWRRLVVVPTETAPECALVRYVPDSLDVEEAAGFQPAAATARRHSLRLALEAV